MDGDGTCQPATLWLCCHAVCSYFFLIKSKMVNFVLLQLITYSSEKTKHSSEMVNVPPSHFKSCTMLLCSLPILIGFWLSSQLQITHMEMIKGIKGHGYYDELVVPIIDNTAHEHQLTESFAKAVCFLLMVL
jgi:hypothetical protein